MSTQGLADALPLVASAIPFGLVTGVAAAESKMPTLIAWSLSPMVFAGAAQLTVVSLAGTVSIAATVGAMAVVNARHVMYSAALAPEFRRQPRWFRWCGSALIIDQNFALALPHLGADPAWFRRYFLTVSVFFYLAWCSTTAIGATIGGAIPDSWQLQFAVPVMFLGLTVGIVKTRPQLVAALVGGAVGLACSGLPDRLGIVLGAVTGVLAGIVADRWLVRPSGTSDPASSLGER